jgi:LuxR family quorum sensing-dependent transcriptional regulator
MLQVHMQALDFIDRSQNYATIDPLLDDYSELIEASGFRSFILTGLPSVGFDVEPLVVCNRWPEEWTSVYRDQAYFPDDPVSQWSLQKETPFYWRDAQSQSGQTPRARRIAGEATEFGLLEGVVFPMRTQQGWQAVISLASDEPLDICKRDEGVLYMASIYFQIAATEMSPSNKSLISLTGREQDILQWAASGKTAWEISCILNISEKTVRNHVNMIHKKLDVRSTTQAVVVALRNHQLHI